MRVCGRISESFNFSGLVPDNLKVLFEGTLCILTFLLPAFFNITKSIKQMLVTIYFNE